jgi:hypothetical protein
MPLVHDTLPILFDKLVMNFGRVDVFIKKSNPQALLTIHGINGLVNTGDVAEGLTASFSLYKSLVIDLCEQDVQMVLN